MSDDVYEYRDQDGISRYEVVRQPNKVFKQRRPDGNGGVVWNIQGIEKLSYRLPELLAGIANGDTVFIVEGEKDAERLRLFGLCATTTSGGAKTSKAAVRKNLPPKLWTYLSGASRIVVLGDNDEPGHTYASTIAHDAQAICSDVRLISPIPGTSAKGDISDWLDDGHTLQDLIALVDATPTLAYEIDIVNANSATAVPTLQQSQRSRSQSDQLIALVADLDVDFFHNSDDQTFATYARDGHMETVEIASNAFNRFCENLNYKKTSRGISNTALATVKSTLSAKARCDGPERTTAFRCARIENVIYIDLANELWEVIEVSSRCVRVISAADCPVRFIRGQGMLPLPKPISGAALQELDPFLPTNVAGKALIKAYLVGAFYPGIPVPVLNLTGPQGSGKSTIARRVRALIDPNRSPLRTEPHDSRDIAAAAKHNYLVVFDNVSNIPIWLSDTMCRLATGGGFASRALYTNDEEHIVQALRPIVITAVNNVIMRGDLADRTINVSFDLIQEDSRATEASLDQDFEATRPRIFGALLDALSMAVDQRQRIDGSKLGRMADFELLGRAAAPAFGMKPTEFAELYRSARATTSFAIVEASPFAAELHRIGMTGFSGSFRDLFIETVPTSASDRRDGDWPSNPKALSIAVSRLIPDLRAIGIEVIIEEPDRNRKRLISIREIRSSEATSATSATSANIMQLQIVAPDNALELRFTDKMAIAATEVLVRAESAGVADVAGELYETWVF